MASSRRRLDGELADRALQAYGRAIAVLDPVRIRLWDLRGLTMSQLRLLFLVSQSEDRPIGELAEEMRIRPATISGLAERLERQRLIERVQDPGDRRVVRVRLTQEGRRVLGEIHVAARSYLEAIFEAMGDAAVRRFVDALELFRTASQTVTEGTGDEPMPVSVPGASQGD